jgi:hypothetical protein
MDFYIFFNLFGGDFLRMFRMEAMEEIRHDDMVIEIYLRKINKLNRWIIII